mmetsp:Transcript_21133/g.54983  ORF Transcript_21133/g.54983 Transcript_21133/m.54983 type:complete len:266 (+) Transcript_21133:346-1143(+)
MDVDHAHHREEARRCGHRHRLAAVGLKVGPQDVVAIRDQHQHEEAEAERGVLCNKRFFDQGVAVACVIVRPRYPRVTPQPHADGRQNGRNHRHIVQVVSEPKEHQPVHSVRQDDHHPEDEQLLVDCRQRYLVRAQVLPARVQQRQRSPAFHRWREIGRRAQQHRKAVEARPQVAAKGCRVVQTQPRSRIDRSNVPEREVARGVPVGVERFSLVRGENDKGNREFEWARARRIDRGSSTCVEPEQLLVEEVHRVINNVCVECHSHG